MMTCFQSCFKFAFKFNLRRHIKDQLDSHKSDFAQKLAVREENLKVQWAKSKRKAGFRV
jgi:hypothetical protein